MEMRAGSKHEVLNPDEEHSRSRKPAKIAVKKSRLRGGYALPENQEIAKENMGRMLAKHGQAARRGLGSGPVYDSGAAFERRLHLLPGPVSILRRLPSKSISIGSPSFLGAHV